VVCLALLVSNNLVRDIIVVAVLIALEDLKQGWFRIQYSTPCPLLRETSGTEYTIVVGLIIILFLT
jgi:hypothetical protein